MLGLASMYKSRQGPTASSTLDDHHSSASYVLGVGEADDLDHEQPWTCPQSTYFSQRIEEMAVFTVLYGWHNLRFYHGLKRRNTQDKLIEVNFNYYSLEWEKREGKQKQPSLMQYSPGLIYCYLYMLMCVLYVIK